MKHICNNYVIHPPYLCSAIPRANQSPRIASFIMNEANANIMNEAKAMKIQRYYDIFRLVVILAFIALVLYFAR